MCRCILQNYKKQLSSCNRTPMDYPNLHNFRWYHSDINGANTEKLLQGKLPGTYLVRDDWSPTDNAVLCVRENDKVSQYRIKNEGDHYNFGGKTFADIPSIIKFYKSHLLHTTTLTDAVEQEWKVVACFNFDGKDPDDLSFQKGEVLTIVSKDEESWWTAENKYGQRGSIPVPFVRFVHCS
ncbi:adapter molecule Crk-like [Dendronephthya gigantea]|uniref:adapter molecule Crk-like n=1 Tax=Dendronephthya gigantea TaxID=151771 RepID=UPI00106A29A9|nr:adapter molecule Crk-like [Dendronephthya gigantea]